MDKLGERLDISLLRSWVGRAAEAIDIITPRLAEEFLATFAPHVGAGDGLAPLGIHWCLAPTVVPAGGLGLDGHPAKGGFLPPVPLPRRMWAGGEVEISGALRVGDTVLRRSRIENVSVKDGRSGMLCFVAVRHEYDAGRGVAISERQDIVYREVATGHGAAAPPAATPPAEPDLSWSVAADSVLLFRYSALTFNGHRIHYDLPYVTGVEGYEGLVVHGPIQATLLLNIAAALGRGPPRRFTYRGQSPMIAGQVFNIKARLEPGGSIGCWTETAAGVPCMSASALTLDAA